MSSTVSIATPTRPTSPRASAWSESMPICVGRSNAVESPVCPACEQQLEARVGLLRRAEARVLPHGPEAAAVHRRLHAARERELAGIAEVAPVLLRRQVLRRVQPVHLHPAGGFEPLAPLRVLAQGGRHQPVRPRPLAFVRGTGASGILAQVGGRRRIAHDNSAKVRECESAKVRKWGDSAPPPPRAAHNITPARALGIRPRGDGMGSRRRRQRPRPRVHPRPVHPSSARPISHPAIPAASCATVHTYRGTPIFRRSYATSHCDVSSERRFSSW